MCDRASGDSSSSRAPGGISKQEVVVMYAIRQRGMVATPCNCLLVTIRNSFTPRIGSEAMQVHGDLWQLEAL
jgi:hypothetical protein